MRCRRQPGSSWAPPRLGGGNNPGPIDVATACNAKGGTGRLDFETETFVASALRACDLSRGVDSDCTDTLVPAYHSTGAGYWQEGVGTLRAREQDSHENLVAHTLQTSCGDYSRADSFNMIAHTLRGEGVDASEDGTTPLVPVAFSCKDYGADIGTISPTLRAMGFSGSHANGGGQVAVAFNLRGREGGAQAEMAEMASLRAASGGSSRSYIAAQAVRRLTPREAERLQGFKDDYTLVPHRGKPAADGPRYKAVGNSMAVPCMSWLGKRIQSVKSHLCPESSV